MTKEELDCFVKKLEDAIWEIKVEDLKLSDLNSLFNPLNVLHQKVHNELILKRCMERVRTR